MMLAFEPDLLVRQIADTTDGNPVELLSIINPADPLIYSIGLTLKTELGHWSAKTWCGNIEL